ncbi:hypothetical protein pb186bvf_010342 [Paramecium bursaria]
MATFQDRFKGKTTIMGRNGLESVINSCQQPIEKQNLPVSDSKNTKQLTQKNEEYKAYIPSLPIQQQQQQPPQYQSYQVQQTKSYEIPKQMYQHNPYNQEQQDYQKFLSQQQYFQVAEQKKTEVRSHSAKGPKQEEEIGGYDQQFIKQRTRYRPYTYQDYEMMKKTAQTRLGGLGPNTGGEDWYKDKEKQAKRQQFAEYVKIFNSTNVTTNNKIQAKPMEQINARQKAMEFAKNIPRPPVRTQQQQQQQQQTTTVKQQPKDPFDDEIAKLEREHLKYLNQLDKIK